MGKGVGVGEDMYPVGMGEREGEDMYPEGKGEGKEKRVRVRDRNEE